MTSEAQHIAALLIRHWQGEISPEEASELRAWAGNDLQRKHLLESFSSPDQAAQLLAKWRAHDKSTIEARLQREFPGLQLSNTVAVENDLQRPVHRVHFLKTAWFRYAAAIIIMVGIGAYLWSAQQKEKPAITQTKPAPVKNDIMPGRDRAVLTLSNGQQIELNNAASETIQDGTLSIENKNGKLIYRKGDMVAMNTMTTPKGGQYQLTLSDGTKVWLNAASSITYPTAFNGNERTVNITGEAYFEVKKNPSKPFVVKTPKEAITVLGTSFNVNAYAEELAMKTSLLEGSVKVGKVVIKPGQAYLDGKVVPTDLDQDVAWKNGAFNFRNMDTEAAFRQLGRWYNVDIRFAGTVPNKKLGGKIGRDLNLSQVLDALKDIGIHTKIEGNTLIILSE